MLDKIVESSKMVMNCSRYVKIDYEVLDKFIEENEFGEMKHWLSDNPYGLLDFDVSTIINFLLYFEVIDYSFWGEPKWTIETSEGMKDGSDALMYSMIKHVNTCGKVNFGDMELDEFAYILKGNVDIPLLSIRYDTMIDIKKIVDYQMNGDFYNYIKNIRDDRELFELIISKFNRFKDQRIYNGKRVYFYKLAQLLVSDILHIREKLEGIDVDYSHLVGCADYKIPQIMRGLGITKYNEELSNLVDNRQRIGVSSKFEVEIRASVIVVLDYISKKLYNTKTIDINDYFFLASKKVKVKKPYHLTRNPNY